MASDPTRAVTRQLEAALRGGSVAGWTDAQLLARFAARRRVDRDEGEAAFAALVERHGAMVRRACRRVLRDDAAAEDAAQAAFLVLARRAGAVGGVESVGGWLHGVATRVASKARVAASRRRARERRGGELVVARLSERRDAGADDPDRWLELHEELARLPEKYRAPLVLCHLEGLTQEQAAEQLRWPLGTVQSRLARGRARLRSALTRRGAAPAVGLLDAGGGLMGGATVPAGWAGATVRAAIEFTTWGNRAIHAGTGPAAARLASEALRVMVIKKLKVAVGAVLALAAVGTVGATSFARFAPPNPPLPPVARPTPPAAAPIPAQWPSREWSITGVVRDEAGRPLAKVWVGEGLRSMMDDWDNPRVGDIRERAEPFRDAQGRVVPPGALGKYFEVRDSQGGWHPVSPDDINPFEPTIYNSTGAVPRDEVARTHSPYNVRVAPGGWWMVGLLGMDKAIRTDAAGRFTLRHPPGSGGWAKIHFASGDSTLQAMHVLEPADLDRPIAVTLRATRLVRARVIETPVDANKDYMNWSFAPIDAAGRVGGEWQQGMAFDPNHHDPGHMKRHLTARVPVGRWRVKFLSNTVLRSAEVEVPPGAEPLDLPDFEVATLATVRMVGQPAAEIDAVDLQGRPVHLSDFRGRAVVLDFWATWFAPYAAMRMDRLKAIGERFRDRPVTILSLHDASVAGPEEYRRAVEPLKREFWGGADLPFPVLLDRAPLAPGRPVPVDPGNIGSGRTADTYEVARWPTTLLIGPDGKLVGEYDFNALEAALDDQFGMPHAAPAVVAPAPVARAAAPGPRRDVLVRGRVIGPDGQGVGGAKLFPEQAVVRQKNLTTDPNGFFNFEAERIDIDHYFLRVEPAAGLANRIFRLDASGEIPEPLILGVGVDVTGRVVRDGQPVAGAAVGLQQVAANRHADSFLGFPATRTGADGRFRFEHAFADQELVVGVQVGSLKDGETIPPRPFQPGPDGSAVDLGDLAVVPGRKLGGRVVFADGRAIPPGTSVSASLEDVGGYVAAPVDPATGRFALGGLPSTEVGVVVGFPDIRTHLPAGYRLSPTIPGLSPLSPYLIKGRLDRDVQDMTILFEPGEPPRMTLDPTRLADFDDARAATITGAPSPK